MRCNQVKKLLSPYMDGELSAERKSLVEDHLGQCPVCRQALEGLRILNALQKSELDQEHSQQYWDEFLPRLRQRIATTSRPSLGQRLRGRLPSLVPASPWLKAAGAAASVVLVFVIGRAVMRDTGTEHILTLQDEEALTSRVEEVQQEIQSPEQEKNEEVAPKRGNETIRPEKKVSGKKTESQSEPLASAKGTPPPSVQKDESTKITVSPRIERPAEQTLKQGSPAGEGLANRTMAFSIDNGLQTYKEGLRQQQMGKVDSAATRFLDIISTYPQSPVADNAQYQLNLIDRSTVESTQTPETWRQQRDAWQNFMKVYPQSEMTDDACLKLADSWYHLALLTANREDYSRALAANRQCQREQKTDMTLQNQARELEHLLNRQRE